MIMYASQIIKRNSRPIKHVGLEYDESRVYLYLICYLLATDDIFMLDS